MRSCYLLSMAMVLPIALMLGPARAAGCGAPPLTPAQIAYLQSVQLEIEVPDGEVPFIQRCDVDGDSVIDWEDIDAIKAARGQPPTHPDDPMDFDGDGFIDGRDFGQCRASCTFKNCSASAKKIPKGQQGKGGQQDPVGSPAACAQVEDFDGDGRSDLVAIYRYTGSDFRSYNWDLEILVLVEDEFGMIEHFLIPWSGRRSEDETALRQHLSLQLAGEVDLLPGMVTIDNPGVVSYRDGVPRELIYFQNGELRRAFYGIDD